MTPLDYIAVALVVLGGVYLVLSLIAYLKTRGNPPADLDGDGSTGRVILNLEERTLIDGEPTSSRMHKLAAICAAAGRKSFSENLDYSVESIAAVDRAIMKGWGESDEEPSPDMILTFGAYVGEVLVRHSRGRWVSSLDENEPASVLLLTRDKEPDAINVSPFMLVREKFAKKYRWDLAIAFTALEQKLKELKVA
jgi:hypothetical protein